MKAYPLQWPAGWPKTEPHRREKPRFGKPLSTALNLLKKEVELLGGKSLVLSSNYTLGVEVPDEPGVCAYFVLRDQHIAIPCDRWIRIEQNVQAIAFTIEAMRGMERWGAKHMITAMFSGFKALPAKAGVDYLAVLGLDPATKLTEEIVSSAYKRKAMSAHPDKGGSAEQWAALREAHDMVMQNVRNGSQ